jgi:hypothetical protein
MKKRPAPTVLALCALLAWGSAAAEARGPATAASATRTGTPAAGSGMSGAVGGYGTTADPYSDTGTGMYGARRLQSAPAILADLLLLRPFGIGLTAAGGALFIATSPFAAIASIAPPHDAFQRSGNALFVAPAAFTFMRPLGEFSYQPSGVYPVRP